MREDDGKDFPGQRWPCARTTNQFYPTASVALANGRASESAA